MGKLVKFHANKVEFHTKPNETGFWYIIKSKSGFYLKKILLYLVFFSKNHVVFKKTNLRYHSCKCTSSALSFSQSSKSDDKSPTGESDHAILQDDTIRGEEEGASSSTNQWQGQQDQELHHQQQQQQVQEIGLSKMAVLSILCLVTPNRPNDWGRTKQEMLHTKPWATLDKLAQQQQQQQSQQQQQQQPKAGPSRSRHCSANSSLSCMSFDSAIGDVYSAPTPTREESAAHHARKRL